MKHLILQLSYYYRIGMFLSKDHKICSQTILYIVWVVALVSTLGSLFFSEVMKLPPCDLCWYQRIAMYPIAILAPLALLSKEASSFLKYIFVLSLIGFSIAVYHNLLYYGIIPDSLTPCKEGISCTSRQIEWWGFVTIPLMALFAFLIILFANLWHVLRGSKNEK